MITRTARFNINKEAALKRKIKTSNEEALVPKLEKGNNLRVFCNTTAFEWVKKMIQNTVSKSNKKKYLRNEDHDEKIRSESTRESKKSSQGEIK